MKRASTLVLATLFMAGMTQAVLAGLGCGKDKAGCTKGAEASVASAQAGDVVEQGFALVMESLPRMTYRVGDLETPCCKTAREASAKSNTPIQYVVAGETYSCRKTAMDKLAEQIQAETPNLAKVVHVVDGEVLTCEKSAAKLAAERHATVKHMVAGVSFDCPHHAQQVADKLAAKLASSHGCAKAFAEGCSKPCATAAGKSGCDKGAATASAKTGGCSKGADAAVASAKAEGCTKSKAGEAKTASATEVKGGCCSKSKAGAAAVATTEPQKSEVTEVAAEADTEETEQLANAKLLVREIVAFVAQARNS